MLYFIMFFMGILVGTVITGVLISYYEAECEMYEDECEAWEDMNDRKGMW